MGVGINIVIVAIFFACLFGFSFAEAAWLNKKNLIQYGKAFAFSFTTNIFSITIGFFFSLLIFFVLLALAWDGTLNQISGNDWRIWGAVVVALLLPVVLLILVKRLGLRLFKMGSVGSPWLFSAAASVIFMLFATSIPVLFLFFAERFL
jgi:hypothetical protein